MQSVGVGGGGGGGDLKTRLSAWGGGGGKKKDCEEQISFSLRFIVNLFFWTRSKHINC